MTEQKERELDTLDNRLFYNLITFAHKNQNKVAFHEFDTENKLHMLVFRLAKLLKNFEPIEIYLTRPFFWFLKKEMKDVKDIKSIENVNDIININKFVSFSMEGLDLTIEDVNEHYDKYYALRKGKK